MRPSRSSMWEEVARRAADDAAAGDVPGCWRPLDSLQVVYCQTWQYDDPVDRLGRRAWASTRPTASTRASAAPPRRCSCRTRRRASSRASSTSRSSSAPRRSTPSAGSRRPGSAWPGAIGPPNPHRSRGRRRSTPPRSPTRCSRPGSTFPLFDDGAPGPPRRRARRVPARRRRAAGADDARSRQRNPYAWFPVERSADELVTPIRREPDGRLPVHEVHGVDHGRRHGRRGPPREPRDGRRARRAARTAASTSAAGATPRTRCTSPSTRTCRRRRRWWPRRRRRSAGAGRSIDDVAHLDLYCCFASSVHFACDALGPGSRRPAGPHRHRRPAVPGRRRQQLPDPLDRGDGRRAAGPTPGRSGWSPASGCT